MRDVRSLRGLLALLVLAALAVGATSGGGTQVAVADDPVPSAQLNDRVRAFAAGLDGTPSAGMLFVGGHFTSSRAPAAPAGTTEVSRPHLLAVGRATGDVLPFAPSIDAPVRALALSPDGATLYAGGDFNTVNGQFRKHLAAFDVATGQLTAWEPRTSASVHALQISPAGDRVYIGGRFGTILSDSTRPLLAAVDPVVGVLDPNWAPQLAQVAGACPPRCVPAVYSLALSADGSALYVGGHFGSVNGVPRNNTAALDTTTAATLPWDPNVFVSDPINPKQYNRIMQIAVPAPGTPADGRVFFCGDFYALGGGTSPNVAAVDAVTGALVSGWPGTTDGGTVACALHGDALVVGGHFDVAHTTGGNVQRRKLAAFDSVTGDLLAWDPTTNSVLGVTAIAVAHDSARGPQVFVGGPFTKLGGVRQQGLAFLEAPGVMPTRLAGLGDASTAAFLTHAVPVTEPGLVTFSLAGDDPAAALWLFLSSPTGQTVAVDRFSSSSRVLQHVVDVPGTWTLSVRTRSGATRYDVDVSLETGPDLPDHVFTNTGDPAGASWFTYSIPVSDPGALDVGLVGSDSGGRANLFVYDPGGSLVAHDNGPGTGPKLLSVTATPGEYRVAVKVKDAVTSFRVDVDVPAAP